jgi:pSer/pThr/pTyr-binding forkhead associated (FHA) protein
MCFGRLLKPVLVLCCLSIFVGTSHARNEVLGEIELLGATKVENTSGVWIDGQYVGYLKELKGSKKILLLPGEHEIAVRQGGYKEFGQRVVVKPGEKQIVRVAMEKDTRTPLPTVTSEIKLSVNPNRAAVFVDGVFVGHVDEFDGVGQAMLIAPGKHKISLSLPGYQTLETEVNLLPDQKFQLKTDLVKAGQSQISPTPNQE